MLRTIIPVWRIVFTENFAAGRKHSDNRIDSALLHDQLHQSVLFEIDCELVRLARFERAFHGCAELQSRRALGVCGKEDTNQKEKECGSIVHDRISSMS